MTPPRWTRLGTARREDYRICRTREDTVRRERDGSSHARFVLECPDWCNVIALTSSGDVVLVRQFRFGTWADTLEIPGGMVDPGETPAQAAARELAEETGYTARELIPLGWVHPNPAFQENRCHTFLALDCAPGTPRPGEDEEVEVLLVPRTRIPELLRNGSITHALVVAAFQLEGLRLRSPGG
jgi:8-oxo-dGTP pyrophosphatase MutT (NUDIX family)